MHNKYTLIEVFPCSVPFIRTLDSSQKACGIMIDLHFPDDEEYWASFHKAVGHLCVFEKNIYSCPEPNFQSGGLVFDAELHELFAFPGY